MCHTSKMFGRRKRHSYLLPVYIGFQAGFLNGWKLEFLQSGSPHLPGEYKHFWAGGPRRLYGLAVFPAPPSARSGGSMGDWNCAVQSCWARCMDALVSQWLKRQGAGTGLAGSMQKKRQLTTSRTLVSVQTPERH